MFTATSCASHYPEQTTYDNKWIDNNSTGISWLNLLTAQPILEEVDGVDASSTAARSNSESNCSSSSVESCYVVLEIQRPRLLNETSNELKEADEEKEEEEHTEEEIEELNFAQTNSNDHNVNHEQFVIPLATEILIEENAVECEQQQLVLLEERAKVTQPIILESSKDILFDKAKTLCRSTKRLKAISHASLREQKLSTSSDNESLNTAKLRTVMRKSEYYPTAITTVSSEQQSSIQNSEFLHYSITSLDSIESKSLSSSPIRTRIHMTFSNLSSQHPLNSTQIQQQGPTMSTATRTRTFAFDHGCMKKYSQVQEQESHPMKVPVTSICETTKEEKIKTSEKTNNQIDLLLFPENIVNCRSLTNKIPTSFYLAGEQSTINEPEFDHSSSVAQSTYPLDNLSKASSILGLMKKYTRALKSEYQLNRNYNNYENKFAEPTLLEVKYLDGRLPLRDDHARESFRQPQTLSTSISTRLNRISLHSMSLTKDLSTSSTSFSVPYRKRMFNRFRSFVENSLTGSTPSPQPSSWQHKTISELFSGKKYTVNRRP